MGSLLHFIIFSGFFFIYVELFEAINIRDITEAERVCLRANGNLHFSEDLLNFVVENNMNDAFRLLEMHGARINIFSDMGINLVLNAIGQRNYVQCENLMRLGITKNTKDYPNDIPRLSFGLVEVFQNETINEYNMFRKYFLNTKFWKNLVHHPLIHHFIERQDLTFCKILITDGFNVNSRDNSGNMPVHVAARVGNSVIMKKLTESNAVVDAKNHANQAPLHIAAKNGHKEVFDILKGFDVDDLRDDFGKTAEDYALEHGHYDKLFLEYLPLYS